MAAASDTNLNRMSLDLASDVRRIEHGVGVNHSLRGPRKCMREGVYPRVRGVGSFAQNVRYGIKANNDEAPHTHS